MRTGEVQSVESLRFYLFDRALHPELFELRAQQRLNVGPCEAWVWVTVCSHVISLHHPQGSLVEVVADAGVELPQRGRLLELPFRGEKEHEHRGPGGLRYAVSFHVERMSPEVYRRTHHDLARAGRRRESGGLFVAFPKWASDQPGGQPATLTPFTYIDAQRRPDRLNVFAYHAFPGEQTIVRVQSLFELET